MIYVSGALNNKFNNTLLVGQNLALFSKNQNYCVASASSAQPSFGPLVSLMLFLFKNASL